MDTSDIDPTAPPGETRCTAHLFQSDKPSALGDKTLPNGSPLRISEDSMLWPPAMLFDAVYAAAVLDHFGAQAMKDEVAEAWKNIFYLGGIITAAHAEYKVNTDERVVSAERAQRAQDRRAQHEARSGPDAFDMLMTLPYIMVPRDELQSMLREAEEKVEEMERIRVHEKVDTWMKKITPDVHDDAQ